MVTKKNETKNELEEKKGKVTITQYLKENKVSSADFFNKLLPNLEYLDFNNCFYEKKFLDELVGGVKGD